MMLCEWDWQAISGFWQGLATLFVGLGAVVGAYKIGSRQVALLDKQTTLQSFALKEAVFDRRFEVFSAAVNFLIEGSKNRGFVEEETNRRFERMIINSKFLFSKEVCVNLADAVSEMAELNRASATLKAQNGYNINSGGPAFDEYIRCNDQIDKRLANILDLFGEMSMASFDQ